VTENIHGGRRGGLLDERISMRSSGCLVFVWKVEITVLAIYNLIAY